MRLHNLPKTTTKEKRRLGLGHGSGRGKTAGRGTKGQKARGKIGLDFEGGALRIIKRLPFQKGKERNNPLYPKAVVLNVKDLNAFNANAAVNIDSLIEKNLVDGSVAKKRGVKILGNGQISKALKVELPVSKTAQSKIEKAGGSVFQDNS